MDNPEPKEDDAKSAVDLEDGTYTAEVTLEGGSGRASIESPATLTVKDGKVTASIPSTPGRLLPRKRTTVSKSARLGKRSRRTGL